jgi:hypothetical protein
MSDCKGCIELAAEMESRRRDSEEPTGASHDPTDGSHDPSDGDYAVAEEAPEVSQSKTDEARKPCGEYHPLPCGMDEWCPVPPEYTQVNAENESQAAYDSWQEDKDD